MDIRYKRVVILTILLTHALTGAAQQHVQQSQSKLASKSKDPVILNVTVTDKHGGFVMGLESKDFEVSIDKKPARIVSVSHADSPVNVGILFDSSGSMTSNSEKEAARNFALLRGALRQFLEGSNKSNDYFLLGFNIKAQLLLDWTSDPLTLADKFDSLQIGDTALYDACYLAIDKVQHGRHAKNALILVSDGLDNISHYSFKELRELLKETNVLFYSLDFPDDSGLQIGLTIDGLDILDELSALSGGMVFFSRRGTRLRKRDVYTMFETIATELRSQYTITIAPNDSIVNKDWHKVKVKVNLPAGAPREMKGLSVRTREGFYAH